MAVIHGFAGVGLAEGECVRNEVGQWLQSISYILHIRYDISFSICNLVFIL